MNKNKPLPFIIGAATIILVLLVVFIGNSNKGTYTPPPVDTSVLPATVNTNTGTTTSNTTGTKTTTTTGANTPKQYTLAEVSTHNNRSDCWTAINGSVYNVTSWISQHPGGADAILSLCGIDGSSAFNAQHGGEKRPANELAGFKIGTLK